MAPTAEVLRVFSGGVDLSVPPQQLPPERAAGGIDLAFRAQAGGGLTLGSRPGLALRATHPLGIASIVQWSMIGVAGDPIRFLIVADVDDNLNEIEPTTRSISQAGLFLEGMAGGVRWAPAQNVLYGTTSTGDCFKLHRSLTSDTLQLNWIGLDTLTGYATIDASGSGETAAGTYEIAWAAYDENTDTLGNRNFLATTGTAIGAGHSLKIDWTAAAFPPRATHIELYIRRTESMTLFWRDTSMRYQISEVFRSGEPWTVTLDPTLAELAAMTTPAPGVTENGMVPIAPLDLCWHQSRMFATDGVDLYYSALNHPEQWDPEDRELVNTKDGQAITRMWSLGPDRLAIFKERSIYLLEGDSPQTWTLRLLTASTGLIAPNALCECDGWVFGWGEAGPWKWDRSGLPLDLADEIVYPRWRAGSLQLRSASVRAAADPVEHRVLFAPEIAGGSTLTVLPYNVELGMWESEGWRVGSPTALGEILLDSGVRGVAMGLANGEILEIDARAEADGLAEAIPVATVAAGATGSVLPLANAPTITGRAAQSVARVVNSSTLAVSEHSYSYGGGNLTISPALADPPPVGSWVVIDQPLPEWESKILEGARAGGLKRYLFLEVRSESVSGKIGILINSAAAPARVFSLRPLMHQRVAALGHECQLRMVWTGSGRIFDVTLLSELIHDRR